MAFTKVLDSLIIPGATGVVMTVEGNPGKPNVYSVVYGNEGHSFTTLENAKGAFEMYCDLARAQVTQE